MIAKIAVSAANFAIDKPYSYRIPQDLTVLPGMRVIVPFGRGNKRSEGVVLGVEEGFAPDLKSVEQVLDEQPLLGSNALRLAAFMRERYFCTFYDAVRVMLPAGLWFRTSDTFSLVPDTGWEEKTIKQADALAVLKLLKDLGGEAPEKILYDAIGSEERFSAAIAYLQKKKWIKTHTDYQRKSSDKTEQIAVLSASCEEAMEFASHRPKSAQLQRAVLELLCSVGSAAVKDICYFTGAKPATVKRLENLGYLQLHQRAVLRCQEIQPAKLDGPLVLNPEQMNAFMGLSAQMDSEKPGIALLHGVTGSGKTSVYVKLIRKCLDEGKNAMLLVPEIALTPQLLGLMVAYFGEKVAVLHSSLGAGERYDQWKRVRSGEATVVIGTRSSVFAPCPNPGLIILDEEQEHSYKSENSPRYSAREIAIWRGARENALVLLGSATPSVETMYHAKQGDYALYTLTQRYNNRSLPQVEIVDMRQELKEGNDLSFSTALLDAIGETTRSGKQSILFLNRRGNSRALVCVDCRESPECPRCSARLTYHSANGRMMCHYCGFSESVPERCPTCGGPLKQVGMGTQKAQEELASVFPDMEILRMDTDTVSAVNTHEKILDRFKNEKVPVLIGTQMVAKGLNLPDVTLVGVIDADLGLYAGGYRAAETTFNMLTQVVGRAGRGDTAGRAIIQTMVPEHQVIHLAARQDYAGFYDLEIAMRQVQNCPPFGDLAVITFTGEEEARVLHGAAVMRDSLKTCLQQPEYQNEICSILGPAPCAVPKINYNFRYQLTLRCRMTRSLRLLIAHLLRQFSQDRSNRGVNAFVDVNGFE